jgi:hypothetical protein
VLVAVAAAPPPDELALDAVDVDRDAAAEHDVDVLERDRREVGAVQRRERPEGRRGVAVVRDATQIGVEVEPLDVPLVRLVTHREGLCPQGVWQLLNASAAPGRRRRVTVKR